MIRPRTLVERLGAAWRWFDDPVSATVVALHRASGAWCEISSVLVFAGDSAALESIVQWMP